MKITAYNGSPRKNGNTRFILDKLLDSPSRKGFRTEIVDLNEIKIKGCQACYYCKSNNYQCILKDEMQPLQENLLGSDVIILGSPIYMWQISGQTKLFIDRLYNFYNFNAPSGLQGKKMILVLTQASQDPKLFSSYLEHFQNSLKFLGFDLLETLVVPGVRMPKEAEKNEGIMQEVYRIGNNLAKGCYLPE